MDSNLVGDIENIRSNCRYVFMMFGGTISQISKQRIVVTLFTTKLEYMVATHAYKEAIWIKRLCLDIGTKKVQ